MTHASCPSVEVLAAFIDGQLDADSRQHVSDHVSTCEECYGTVLATGITLQSMDSARSVTLGHIGSMAEDTAPRGRLPGRPRRQATWWLVAAATLVVSVGGMLWSRGSAGADSYERAVAPLREVVGSRRFFFARVAGGFQYGPLVARKRATALPDSAQLELLNVLARMRASAEAAPSDARRQAAAVATLFAGDTGPAIDELRSLSVTNPNDAQVWVNLGAGYLIQSDGTDSTQDVARSLEATERALVLSPTSEEALTNRAIALQRLGLAHEASEAWARVREAAKDPRWATPDRLLGPIGWEREESPDDRRWAIEERLVPRWARGSGLAGPDSEPLMAALEQIPESRRGHLQELLEINQGNAAGAVAFRALGSFAAGLDLGKREDWRGAHEAFGRASQMLRGANSSLANWVEVQGAIALYYLGKYDDALAQLDGVLRRTPAHHHSVRGRALWVRGLITRLQGAPLEGARLLGQGAAEFRAAGEEQNASLVDCLRGGALYAVGQREEAWKLWEASLRVGPRLRDPRHAYLVYWEIARAVQDESPYTARALGIELREVTRSHNDQPVLQAAVDHAVARVLSRVGDLGAAESHIREAKERLRRQSTPLARFFETEIALAEGEVMLSRDAPRTLASEANARKGYGAVSLRFQDIVLHGLRARALEKEGRVEEAKSELVAALARVEKDGGSSPLGVRVALDLGRLRLDTGDTMGALEAFNTSLALRSAQPSLSSLSAREPGMGASGGLCVILLALDNPRPVALVLLAGASPSVLRLQVKGDDLRATLAEARREIAIGVLGRAAKRTASLLRPVFAQALAAGTPFLAVVGEPAIAAFPFATLLAAEAPARPLPAIVAMPSLRKPRRAAGMHPFANRIAAFGSMAAPPGVRPLLTVRSDAQEVSAKYRSGTSMVGRAVTKAAISGALQVDQVVHIDAHSTGDSAGGSAGLLLQAGDAVEAFLPGVVTSRLVILAACNTASVRPFEPSTSGLPWQLLARGADVVLVTLWDIDDSAAGQALREVHDLMARGATPASAVALLQRRHPLGSPLGTTAAALQVMVHDTQAAFTSVSQNPT